MLADRNARYDWLWTGRVLLGLLVFAPVAWVLIYSLLSSLGVLGSFGRRPTFSNWIVAVQSGVLWQNILYTLSVSGVSTLLAGALSLGFVLYRAEERNRRSTHLVLCLLLGTPSVVMGFIVYQLLNPGGYLARLAHAIGLLASPDHWPALVNDRWAVGIIVAQTLVSVPLLTLYFFNIWETAQIDRFRQLAHTLGATPTQSRWQVACPMLWKRGWSMLLLSLLFNLGSYEIPLLLGRQSPQFLSVLTQRHFGQFDLADRPVAFVLSVVYFILAAGLLWVMLSRRPVRD